MIDPRSLTGATRGDKHICRFGRCRRVVSFFNAGAEPSPRMTGLRYFRGDHPHFRHEFEQLQELDRVVAGSDLPGPIYLASNFLLANGEIDCLLLLPRGMVVLDLKAYQGAVRGAEEGEWTVEVPDGATVPLRTNLFRQLRTHRFDLANRLLRIREDAFPQIEEKALMRVGAWGYFKRGSTYPEGQIDLDRVKWFDIVTADTLAERLMLVDAGFTIGEREMDAIVGALRLAPAEGLGPAPDGTGRRETAPPAPAGTGLETALVDRMDAIVARMEAIPEAIAGLVPPAEACTVPPAEPLPGGAPVPGGCSDGVGPDESGSPLAERIRAYVCERHAAPARREGRIEFEVTSGEVHRGMGLANRMSAVCGALRGRKLEERCGIELVEEVRSVRVRENSATNRFVYRVGPAPSARDR